MNQRFAAGVLAFVALAGSGLLLAWPVPSWGTAPVTQAAGNPTLVLDTANGVIEIELLRGDAPKSVEYIIDLVKKNFYRGLRFHRAERSLVQVGDAQSRDVSKKAYWGRNVHTPTIGVAEISKKLIHVRGTVGLAYAQGGTPEGANSQFYIMKEASPSLNGKYTIIGRVRAGMVVVDNLQVGDLLKQATIKEAAPK
jgi:cyclophilin family peptidyl-prolyl cis-trans isomerase